MTILKTTRDRVRAFRLARSGLITPFATPDDAARGLVGVQAQILVAAGLSLANRAPLARFAELEAALLERRTLLQLWGQRHTLHLYPSGDWPLMYSALSTRQTWWERKVEKAGGDVAAYGAKIDAVIALLEARGTLTRSDLRSSDIEFDEDWQLSSWGGIFSDLVRRGVACHAGRVGGEGRFAHRSFWLPDLEWTCSEALVANAELARRYLRAYGPATVRDLAYWRSGRVADARSWIQALGDAVVEVQVDGVVHLLLAEDVPVLQGYVDTQLKEAPVHALYRFDPLLLAHKDKTWWVPEKQYARVWRPAGHIEPVLLIEGQVVGTWLYKRNGKRLSVTLSPFKRLRAADKRAIRVRLEAVASFLDMTLLDVAR